MLYLTNTFSPQMLGAGRSAVVREVPLAEAERALNGGYTSAISHEVTANVLSALLAHPVHFNRISLTIQTGDVVVAIIPAFRAGESREFTKAEIESAGYRCFIISVQ